MGIIKEFREFAIKGNVIDMAVGIVIGAAFTAIVQSLVKDILMPPIGYMLGNVDFKDLAINMGTKVAPVTINYGAFINAIINFGIVAFAMFIVIKAINKLKKKQAAAPAKPTKDQELLTEIRDLLKSNQSVSE